MDFINLIISLLTFCSFSEAWVTPDQLTSSKRISETMCDNYKNMIAVRRQFAGLPGYLRARSRLNTERVTYKCNNMFAGMIVGGVKTKPGEFAHMAAIGWRSGSKIEFKCGGSLISERFLLTVAHCVKDENNEAPSVVRLGDQNLGRSDDGARPVEYNILRIIKHESYDSSSKENDIALIELERNVTIDKDFVRPACLQVTDDFNRTIVATGWGQTSTYSGTSDELQKVALNITSNQECYEILKDEIRADQIFGSQICAGGVKNQDTCRGDSGGPIQVSHTDAPCVYNIVGMTSYGSPKCGAVVPSIYTRISFYIDWIEEQVWPQH